MRFRIKLNEDLQKEESEKENEFINLNDS